MKRGPVLTTQIYTDQQHCHIWWNYRRPSSNAIWNSHLLIWSRLVTHLSPWANNLCFFHFLFATHYNSWEMKAGFKPRPAENRQYVQTDRPLISLPYITHGTWHLLSEQWCDLCVNRVREQAVHERDRQRGWKRLALLIKAKVPLWWTLPVPTNPNKNTGQQKEMEEVLMPEACGFRRCWALRGSLKLFKEVPDANGLIWDRIIFAHDFNFKVLH